MKPNWLTAHQVTTLTKLNRKQLAIWRKNNSNKGFFKQGNGRSFLYKADVFNTEILLKKTA